jgi:hypothetical protein
MAKAKAKAKAKGRISVKGTAGAKSKPAVSSRRAGARPGPRGGARRPGKAAVGKSGVMPEIGAARREATQPLSTRPTAARRPSPRKARAQLPGEKAIADTDQTVPVKPERIAPGDAEPMPAPAIDRRRQIVGTDDPGTRSRG